MNILLVTIDCLRRDRCGIYGHHRNTTPTLDALAQEAHVFENAYATGPVTTESFPGILAGRLSAQTVAGSAMFVPYRYEIPFLMFRHYQYLSGWPSVRGETVVDKLLDVLDTQSSPFFGWTHLMDVHGPLHPKTVVGGGFAKSGALTQFRSHAKRVSNVHDPQTETRYDSAVRYADDQIQRIIDWLQECGLWEETALIVTADHGDALHDRGTYGHPQHYIYEELLSVPLIVRLPDSGPERIERLFSLGWLHELIAEVGQLPTMDAPLLSDCKSHLSAGESSEQIVVDSISHRGHSIVVWQEAAKYVRQTYDLSDANESTVGTPGIYRLDEDPKERSPRDELVPAIERIANGVEIDSPEDLRTRDSQPGVSAETRNRLEQLGYAE